MPSWLFWQFWQFLSRVTDFSLKYNLIGSIKSNWFLHCNGLSYLLVWKILFLAETLGRPLISSGPFSILHIYPLFYTKCYFYKIIKNYLQSCNKSLIDQACSGPYWENIGPRSFLYGPRYARSVLSRPRADILPVRPSRLVNKIYLLGSVFSSLTSSETSLSITVLFVLLRTGWSIAIEAKSSFSFSWLYKTSG